MVASINDLPAGDQPSLYLTAYQAWLSTQPLSVHIRRAYLSRLRLFCSLLQNRVATRVGQNKSASLALLYF